MNKSELVDFIAGEAEISKAAAGRALDAVTTAVKKTLKKGGTVTLVGFGRQLKCLNSVLVKH